MTKEHEVKFGTLQVDGTVTNVRMIKQSTFANCPFYIFDPGHYREDGSCKCDDPEVQKELIRYHGYKKSDFKKVGK
jgi:hypothetical protein